MLSGIAWRDGAVEPVAPDDVVGLDPLLVAVGDEGEPRAVGGDVVQLDVGGLEVDLGAALIGGGVQVFLQVRLPVRHEARAGVLLDVDRQDVTAAPHDAGAGVHVALGVHAIAETDLAQQLDRSPLEDAGPDPPEHVLPTRSFDDDRVDAGPIEDVGEQCAGRAGTDDGDLRGDRHGAGLADC